MVRLGRLRSVEGEYFLYRKAAKFISEILVALSAVIGLSSIGILIGLGIDLRKPEVVPGDILEEFVLRKDISFALFIYTVLILIVSISDVVFAVILQIGIRQLKLTYCLFWRGATITSLLVCGMLTLAFITMVHDLVPMLGYLPSLISKPFSLWIVNGFIVELGELRSFPFNTVGNNGEVIQGHPPAKPTFSLDDLEGMKNKTTVFYMNQKASGGGGAPGKYTPTSYIVSAKLQSIPEGQ